MRKIKVIWLVFVLLLASCGGDHFQREKDLYPEIPNFPEFQGEKLKAKKIEDIRLKLNDKFKRKSNQYYFNYLIKDSTLYMMTYFTDTEFPDIPSDNDYLVDLVIISNHKPVKHFKWTMDDFAINFDVDNNRNVIVGKHKYLAETDYSVYNIIPYTRNDNSTQQVLTYNTWQSNRHEKIAETDYFKSFNSAIVDADGSFKASVNSGYGYSYSPVYLVYYKMNYKDKVWQTKINYKYNEAPLLLELGQEIYYVSYIEKDLENSDVVKQYSVYKIEGL